MLSPRTPCSRRAVDAAARISRRTAGSGPSLSRRLVRRAPVGSASCVIGGQVISKPLANAFRCQAVVGQSIVVYTARAGFMGRCPLVDRGAGRIGEAHPQTLGAGTHSADRIALQVGERDVGEPVVTHSGAEIHCPPDTFNPAVYLLGAKLLRIVAVAAPAAHVLDEAAHRAHHFGWITMTPQEFSVRVGLD